MSNYSQLGWNVYTSYAGGSHMQLYHNIFANFNRQVSLPIKYIAIVLRRQIEQKSTACHLDHTYGIMLLLLIM